MRYGVDADAAELAGLLHDYCRDETDEGLIHAAEELGVPVLAFEREHPWTCCIRGFAAARVRRELLRNRRRPSPRAIAVHTVGAVPMSDLDKVVYLADMIEPARTYSGVAGAARVMRVRRPERVLPVAATGRVAALRDGEGRVTAS